MEKIKLELEPQELLLVAEGLSYLPIRTGSFLLNKVQQIIKELQEKEGK